MFRIFQFCFLFENNFSYQPDYLSSDPEETLTLNTNIGLLTFPIVVRIPKRVLATCFQHLPRPVWELRTSLLCICFVSIIVIIVIISAFSEARELICHVKKTIFSSRLFR